MLPQYSSLEWPASASRQLASSTQRGAEFAGEERYMAPKLLWEQFWKQSFSYIKYLDNVSKKKKKKNKTCYSLAKCTRCCGHGFEHRMVPYSSQAMKNCNLQAPELSI
jgi:hypothetical protein